MNIALKEANETLYWLRLMHKTQYLTKLEFQRLEHDVQELIAILVSITKSMKNNSNNK